MRAGTGYGKWQPFCLCVARPRAAAIAFVTALLLSAPTSADASDIAIRDAWSRATPKGAQVGAGYFTIENRGNSADKLLSASASIAGKVEIHEMLNAGGLMRMRPVKEGLIIPAGGRLAFAPGGSHIMFLELKSPFVEGDQVRVSLEFEKAGKMNASFEVGSIGAKGPRFGATTSETTRHSIASNAEPFFTHIHDIRLMANVTVSPGRSGPVEVLVQLEDPQENALAADELSITLSNTDSGIAPITTTAERIANDTWRARMLVSTAGRWSLSLRIAVTSNETLEIAAPILIE